RPRSAPTGDPPWRLGGYERSRSARSCHRGKRNDIDPGGQIMLRDFFAWTPLVVIVGTAVLLTIPYLALIALMVVAVGALAARAVALVAVPYVGGRAVARSLLGRTGASPRRAEAPRVHGHAYAYAARRRID